MNKFLSIFAAISLGLVVPVMAQPSSQIGPGPVPCAYTDCTVGALNTTGNITETKASPRATLNATTGDARFQAQLNGVTKYIAGAVDTTDNIIVGSVVGDAAVRGASRVLISGDGGNSYDLRIDSTHGLIIPKLASAPVAGPGAGFLRIFAVAGTDAGTCKIQTQAGTSNTAVTVTDNIGTGC